MSTKPTTIRVTAEYTTCVETEITLPEGYTWADIKSWYVKWNIFNATFHDGTGFVEDLTEPELDLKHPDNYDIVDTDGNDLGYMR